jgi:hypothetical protein
MPAHLHRQRKESRNLEAGPDCERFVSLCAEQLGLLGREFLIGEDSLRFERAQALELGDYILLWGRRWRWWRLWGMICLNVLRSIRISLYVLVRLPAVYGITGGSGRASHGRCPYYPSY